MYSNTASSASNFSASKAASKLSNKPICAEYTYGFSWTVDTSANTYNLTVFVDFNNDGNMTADEIIFMVDQKTGHDNNGADPIYSNSDKSLETAVWNQYAYMLLDNSFYTSNDYGTATYNAGNFGYNAEVGVTLFTDLLTQNSGSGTAYTSEGKDKATFDIDYVRVYQQDGRRDLVTKETEAFNTANHFGY